MSDSSYEAMVRRVVRDHQRTARAAGAQLVITASAEPGDGFEEVLRAGHAHWLRATAVAGLTSALLVPPTAASAVTADPGLSIGARPNPGVNATSGLLASSDPAERIPAGVPVRTATVSKPAPAMPAEDVFHALDSLTPSASAPTAEPSGPAPALAADITLPLEDPMAGRERHDVASRPSAPLPSQTLPPEYTERADTASPGSPRRGRAAPAPRSRKGVPTTQQTPRPSAGSAAILPSPARRPPEVAPSAPLREDMIASAARPVTSQRVTQWAQAVGDALGKAAGPPQGSPRPSVIAFEETAASPTLGWSYEVQRGDSLWRIGERIWTENPGNRDLDRTWRLLFEWNDEALEPDPDLIHPGQVLEIPVDTWERHPEAQ